MGRRVAVFGGLAVSQRAAFRAPAVPPLPLPSLPSATPVWLAGYGNDAHYPNYQLLEVRVFMPDMDHCHSG